MTEYHVVNAGFNLYLTSRFNLQKMFNKWHLRRTLMNWKVKWKNTVHNNSAYLPGERNKLTFRRERVTTFL